MVPALWATKMGKCLRVLLLFELERMYALGAGAPVPKDRVVGVYRSESI